MNVCRNTGCQSRAWCEQTIRIQFELWILDVLASLGIVEAHVYQPIDQSFGCLSEDRLRDVRISLVQLRESPSPRIGHAQHTAEQLLDSGGAADL